MNMADLGFFQYDVFISYRHRPLDDAVAVKAFHTLESYKMPKALARQGYAGVARVFRDTEELAVSGILSDTIQRALHTTRTLLVICSPDTPQSEWVDREVATFIELGRADHIFALLIGGDADTSFPKSLKKVPDIDDRTLDVRADGQKQVLANLPGGLLPVIAQCAGCTAAALQTADRLRRTARSTLRYGLGTVGVVLVVAIAGWLWMLAGEYRQQAVNQQATTMDLIETLTYDLPTSLAEVPGTYGIVSTLLAENVGQINTILEMATNPDTVQREKAINLRRLADTYAVLGNHTTAVASAEESADLFRALYQRLNTSAALADYTESLSALGNTLSAGGDYQQAEACFEEAVTLQATIACESDTAQTNLGRYYHNRATNLVQTGATREAVEMELESVHIYEALMTKGVTSVRANLLIALQNIGSSYNRLGEYTLAIGYLQQALEITRQQYEANPSRFTLGQVADSTALMAYNYYRSGQLDQANQYYEETIAHREYLAEDKENQTAQADLAAVYGNYGVRLNTFEDYDAAREYFEKALAIYRQQAAAGTPAAMATYARACYNIAENELDAGRLDDARAYYNTCLEVYGQVAEGLGDYHNSQYLARRAYYKIVFTQDFEDALADAQAAIDLMSDTTVINLVYAYALMYNDRYDESMAVFHTLIDRGESDRQNIREDFRTLRALGLEHPTMADVEALL
ncbi:MAG: tetratricopeptide repeat protein [Ruminococcaceae bacterium]|nr:tetratricopeptide repeat protein [Oscillospiraceae bacterium]